MIDDDCSALAILAFLAFVREDKSFVLEGDL